MGAQGVRCQWGVGPRKWRVLMEQGELQVSSKSLKGNPEGEPLDSEYESGHISSLREDQPLRGKEWITKVRIMHRV